MSSANSFFNVYMCKKQVKRFWPLWSMYAFVLFILMPVYLLLQSQNKSAEDQNLFSLCHQHGIGMAVEPALFIALFFGILVAMAMWSYLYNNRSVSMIHALPMTRKTLFFTNYLTGILFFLVPNVVIFLLTLGAEAMIGSVAIKSLAIWLLCQTLLCFFFYSFAALLAFVTGHILILPCLYAIFNFLTLGLSQLLDWSFSEFVYGYAAGSVPVLDWFGKWLSPAYALTRELRVEYPMIGNTEVEWLPETIQGLPVVSAYALAGLVMAILAYLLYRNRKLELSGEVIVVSYLRPIFRYGVAICAAMVFGNIFYQVFQDIFTQGIVSLLFFLLLWGAIGYFGAEMLLQKSFRVIKQSFKGCLVLMALLSVAVLAMEWDLSGYEKALPSADQVEKVMISDQYTVSSVDPEYIAAVLALQGAILNEKDQVERWQRGEDPAIQKLMYQSQETDGVYIEKFSWHCITLDYTLKDGTTMKRAYQIPVTEELLEKEGSSAALYTALANRPEWRLHSIFPDILKAQELIRVEVGTVDVAHERDGVSMTSDSVILSGENAQLLYQAVREDMQEGRLGIKWLLQNEEYLKTNYVNTIYFTFRGDYNTDDVYAGDWYEKEDQEGSSAMYEVSLPIQRTATSTLAVLEQLNLIDRINLMSEYDMQWERYQNVGSVSYKDRAY